MRFCYCYIDVCRFNFSVKVIPSCLWLKKIQGENFKTPKRIKNILSRADDKSVTFNSFLNLYKPNFIVNGWNCYIFIFFIIWVGMNLIRSKVDHFLNITIFFKFRNSIEFLFLNDCLSNIISIRHVSLIDFLIIS